MFVFYSLNNEDKIEICFISIKYVYLIKICFISCLVYERVCL